MGNLFLFQAYSALAHRARTLLTGLPMSPAFGRGEPVRDKKLHRAPTARST
ncbi:hypothetical protein TFLX_01991 [Thermoflexales bacterium]|nr:hypothetical protein TFLX_01991 [Thermoflexales bacterium]